MSSPRPGKSELRSAMRQQRRVYAEADPHPDRPRGVIGAHPPCHLVRTHVLLFRSACFHSACFRFVRCACALPTLTIIGGTTQSYFYVIGKKGEFL